MTQQSVFETVGRLFFTRSRVKKLDKQLNTAGIDIPVEGFAGYLALNIIVIGVVLAFALFMYKPVLLAVTGIIKSLFYIALPEILVFLLLLIFSLAFCYLSGLAFLSTYLILRTDDRRTKLENAMPDFLVLVASNLKAGMTLDQAMWYSAKPEFGLLADEVKRVIKSAFSGESLENALDRLKERFDSRLFTRTINLIKQASSTGGELTDVLERTAQDARNTLIMKKEISASLVLYEIFVLFAAVVGTPFLFSVATRLITVFEKISPQIPTGGGSSVGIFGYMNELTFSGPIITSQEFIMFSIPTIFITALFSSFIVSIIRTGSKGEGLKYFPFVLVASFIVYWLVDKVLGSVFVTLM
jgi:Flp pilus assembly protein TadB